MESEGLEGDIEGGVSGVWGDFFNLGFSKEAGKGVLQVFYAIIYLFRLALDEHLNSPIRGVADKAS